jgi:NhaA family Na+:H+ antiporter
MIALFYTSQLSVSVLAIAVLGCAALAMLNARGVCKVAPYLLVGLVIWVCVLKSGVHATLAGVLIALFIPIRSNTATREDYRDEDHASPLKRLEHALSPWVAFGVMPLFAFANAGVSLWGLSFTDLFAGIPLGIAAGLFIGKQIGIFGATWVVVKLGIARMPDGVTWLQIYGVSIIAGIGFTMSLFIGTLAYADPAHASGVRIGVLAGSFASAVLGILVLRFATATKPEGAAAALEPTVSR